MSPTPKKKAPINEASPKPVPAPRIKLYMAKSWKGVKTVFQCSQCSHCDDLEDDMKLHVLNHFPESDRERVLTKLTNMKEVYNG